jgi:glucokinase
VTVIAIDLGGTKVASAVVSADGDILARGHALLGGRGGDDVASLVVQQCRVMLERAGADSDCSPTAVGVTVPGIYRTDSGTVWAPNIPAWDDYPLQSALQQALGSHRRVVIDSDRAAYILGETWRGAARGARDAIFLAVGTGIGAGILLNGRVLRGHADIAGAIGWLALDRPYVARYASCGCFEGHASGPGLVTVARERLEATPPPRSALRATDPNALTAHEIFAAAEAGDELATSVLDNAVELWGMAAANLVSLFNPETIVFGGGIFGPAVRFLDRVRAEAERWAQPIAMRQVTFVASALGGDAGLYGAARLALTADTPLP